MRIHDVIRTTAAVLERMGHYPHYPHVEVILAQFPDLEIGDDRAKWNMDERIINAFEIQVGEERVKAVK